MTRTIPRGLEIVGNRRVIDAEDHRVARQGACALALLQRHGFKG
jgi:hypothetical protein